MSDPNEQHYTRSTSQAFMRQQTGTNKPSQSIAQTARLTDLDADPHFLPEVLALYRACMPGRNHAVCGEPSRMARTPIAEDFTEEALGVLLLVDDQAQQLLACLAICSYSDQQVTIWGPVVHRGYIRDGLGRRLLHEAKSALADGGFESLRSLIDLRNRPARAFALAHGLKPWRDNAVYEYDLLHHSGEPIAGVSIAQTSDLETLRDMIREAFPESEHANIPLSERISQGYRYYIIQSQGHIRGTAAIMRRPGRTWLHLISINATDRGIGYGQQLLAGIIAGERQQGMTRLGLEVITDNKSAVHLYQKLGFRCLFTATIMAGSV